MMHLFGPQCLVPSAYGSHMDIHTQEMVIIVLPELWNGNRLEEARIEAQELEQSPRPAGMREAIDYTIPVTCTI